MEEGDVTRKRLLEDIATFLQMVLPHGGTPPALQSMPPPITPTVQTGLHQEVSETASPSLPFLSRAHESVFASPIKDHYQWTLMRVKLVTFQAKRL